MSLKAIHKDNTHVKKKKVYLNLFNMAFIQNRDNTKVFNSFFKMMFLMSIFFSKFTLWLVYVIRLWYMSRPFIIPLY